MKTDSTNGNLVKIINALDEYFALSIDELKSKTQLKDEELLPALEWMFEMHEAFPIDINN